MPCRRHPTSLFTLLGNLGARLIMMNTLFLLFPEDEAPGLGVGHDPPLGVQVMITTLPRSQGNLFTAMATDPSLFWGTTIPRLRTLTNENCTVRFLQSLSENPLLRDDIVRVTTCSLVGHEIITPIFVTGPFACLPTIPFVIPMSPVGEPLLSPILLVPVTEAKLPIPISETLPSPPEILGWVNIVIDKVVSGSTSRHPRCVYGPDCPPNTTATCPPSESRPRPPVTEQSSALIVPPTNSARQLSVPTLSRIITLLVLHLRRACSLRPSSYVAGPNYRNSRYMLVSNRLYER